MPRLISRAAFARAACAAFALACLAGAPAAHAQTTLNFENLSNPNNATGTNTQAFSVTQNGFTVTDTTNVFGFRSVAPNGNTSGFNYTGSVALYNNTFQGTTTLTQNNGLAFTLNSIGIATLFAQPATPGAVTFTGNVQGGGTVTQSFTNGANNNLETVIFGSNFTNLTSVSFARTTAAIQFDNIVVNGNGPAAVPEPSQTAALGLGMLGLSGLMLKARKRKASGAA